MSSKNEISRIEYVNEPEPEFLIREVSSPEIVYEVDYEQREKPRPKDFDDIGTAQVKLVCASIDLPDELEEIADEANEKLGELLWAMAEYRDLDEEAAQNVVMGNLDALPEVTERD